jgi:hypothetical protein
VFELFEVMLAGVAVATGAWEVVFWGLEDGAFLLVTFLFLISSAVIARASPTLSLSLSKTE